VLPAIIYCPDSHTIIFTH